MDFTDFQLFEILFGEMQTNFILHPLSVKKNHKKCVVEENEFNEERLQHSSPFGGSQ